LACKYLISELASIKQDDNLLSKNAQNTLKAKKIVAPGERNLQSKHDLICNVVKVKASTSAHSMANMTNVLFQCIYSMTTFFSVYIIPFKSKVSMKPKRKYILHTMKKTIGATLSMY